MVDEARGEEPFFIALSDRAEQVLQERGEVLPENARETIKLMRDLHKYRIELELQNQDLCQAQIELEESRSRYADLYDFAPMGYLTVNASGMVVEANLAAGELLGLPRFQLISQPFSNFIQPDDQDRYYLHRQTLLAEQGKKTCQLRLCRANGSGFYAQLISSVMPSIDGSTGWFRIALMDISLQKEQELRLCRNEREWEKCFDAIDELVTIQDKDFYILKANKAARAFCQSWLGDPVGRKCYELFHRDGAPCAGCPVLCCGSNPIQVGAGRESRILELSLSKVLDEQGELEYWVHIGKDLTERHQLEAELLQAHKMEALGTLTSGIAHDFNNILTVMIGFAELARQTGSLESSMGHLDQILGAGHRAKDLVQQILAFSRKQVDRKPEPFQPHLVVKEVLKMMQASIPKGIQLRYEIDESCFYVMLEPTYLHQIVANLCINAIQALPNRGQIVVRMANHIGPIPQTSFFQADKAFVCLTVEDNGCGMDAETRSKIFEPFFTTKEPGKGSGLGLAVVNDLLKKLSGFITVESELGQGSTFRVYLPAHVGEQQQPISLALPDLPTGNERILTIDDEVMVSAFLGESLTHLGYRVSACDEVHGLAAFLQTPNAFDLVLVDQNMPGQTGIQMARQFRAIRPDLPIILLSGSLSETEVQEAQSAGIQSILDKPILLPQLARAVRDLLDR